MDGHPAVPLTPTLQQDFVFPMALGRKLEFASTMHNRIILYRRASTSVGWNAHRFMGLSSPVMIYTGAELPRTKLQAMGIERDPTPSTEPIV